MRKINFFLVSLLFTLIIMKVNAQDSCRNSVVINSIFNTQVKDTTISINSTNVCWATFTASSNTDNLNIYRGANNTVLISTINLYHGSCDTLILDSTINVYDTIFYINFNFINTGYNYFVKINFNNSFSGDIILDNIPYVSSCNSVDGCGPIKNSFFNYVLNVGQGNNSSLNNAFQLNAVCSWNRALGQPDLEYDIVSNPDRFVASLGTNNNQTQAIYQHFQSALPVGEYTLGLKYKSQNLSELNVLLTNYSFPTSDISGNSNGMDNIPSGLLNSNSSNLNIGSNLPTNIPYLPPCWYTSSNTVEHYQFFSIPQLNTPYHNIVIYPKSSTSGSLYITEVMITPQIQFEGTNPYYVCHPYSSTITITAKSPTTDPVSSFYWKWMDVPQCSPCYNSPGCILNSNSNCFLTIATPSVTTTYYVEADNYNGCRYYGKITVVVDPTPQPLTISGSLNDKCHLKGVFNVVNPQQGITYTWTVSGGTSSNLASTSSLYFNDQSDITWNSISIPGTITVEGRNAAGCLIYQGTFSIDANYLNSLLAPTPTTVTINGPTDLGCDMVGNYSVILPTNPAPPSGTTWTWVMPGNATSSCNPCSAMSATWNNAGKGYITIEGYDSPNHCLIYSGTLLVDPDPDCSVGVTYIASPFLNTTTASEFLITYNGGLYMFSTNDPIYIDGTFIIDTYVFFINCPNIVMGPNAKIIVNSNNSIDFLSCHIYACSCAWDGIYALDPTANIYFDDNVTIQDAKNAIVSINNGNIQIYNSTFVNNLIGIWVKDYNSESNGSAIHHQGYISGSTFKYDANNYPAGPYSNSNHITGIVVDNVLGLTIGDNSDPAFLNNFENIQYGIKTLNSVVTIYNNTFDDIWINSSNPPSYSYNEPNEAAIYCIKDPNVSYGSTPYQYFTNPILIGGYGNIPNTFNKCNIGIYGKNIKPDIEQNTFNAQRYTGVHLIDCRDTTIIEKNIINMDPSLWATNNLYNSSIIDQFVNASLSYPLLIHDNAINETRTGIYLTNCVGSTNGPVDVANNDINFGTVNPIHSYYGIRSGSGANENIANNNITFNTTPNSGTPTYLKGMWLRDLTNSTVRDNTITKMGMGINGLLDLTGTEFWCNRFIECWEGIDFGSAIISDQVYQGNEATDNTWYDISSANAIYRVTGNIINFIPMVNWYHEGDNWDITNTMSPYIYASNTLIGSIYPVDNQLEGCSNNKKSLQQQLDLSVLLKKIIMDSITYDTLQTENKYYAKTFAYKYLDVNQSYFNLGTSNDSIYQIFYNTTKLTNIGKLNAIDIYIKDRNYTNANTLNTSLTGINLPEFNLIEVNRIYLGKLINDTISVADSASLANIAYQEPSTGGKGVYGARVLLGLDPYDSSLPQNLLPPGYTNKTDSTTSDIKVYPNPANNKLYIELDNTTDGTAKIEFYDLTGKLYYSTTINTAIKLQSLNISRLKAGIYNLHIVTNNNTKNQKLVIIK